MRELFKLSLILAIICCGAALSLAYVYNLTKEPIAEQKRLKKKRAIQAVFPNLQQTSAPESINVPIGSNNKGEEQFRPHYILKIDESVSGVAFEVETPGYGGPIAIMAGVDNQLSVTGIKIISHSETPGLGANITSDDFCRQFSGKDLTDS
ncbi:MAG: RnfABCDGE type electron transport complex subunit G, partial [Deltaproteobacteria bacterium]|nr:RnfABCDGE type electron transport complex subunit G [Deltaproteobacteria bacterium]